MRGPPSPIPDDVLYGPLAENFVWPVAVGLTLALLGAVVALVKSRHFRSWLWMAARWPGTIRVTTVAQIDQRRRAAERHGARLVSMKLKEAQTLGQPTEPEPEPMVWTDAATREVFPTGEADPPRPRPRWFIGPVHAETDTTKIYLIKNLTPEMTLFDIRLEHPDGKVVFHDAAAWAKLRSGEEAPFRATYSYRMGVLSTLEVAWTDEQGRRDGEKVQLFTGLYATHSLWTDGDAQESP